MSWIDVTYRIRASADSAAAVAHAIALEQSVEVPLEVVRDAFVAEHIVGRVDGVHERDDGTHDVRIRLATRTAGFDVAQTLNMLFGNSSLHAHVELIDVDFPSDFLARFSGPRFGIEGIRAMLGVERRALTCAALKPQGLPADRLAALCYTLARAGVDVIKDDHGLADQDYAPFAQRASACQRAVARAWHETGHRAAYAPSMVGSPAMLSEQAGIASDAGVAMVLLAPALIGMPAFAEVVRERIDVPVIAHPAFAGSVRIAPAFMIGKWFRLLGADAVIFPGFGGRFAWDESTCGDIARNARQPWANMRPALPVPGGGMSVERARELVAFYGDDVMLLIGGSLLGAPERVHERAASFVRAVRETPEARGVSPAASV
ncbi:MAG: RuBisCO large subunit C-terminal-like domain-containing protein [Betaproteobacteria bacterium]